MLQRGIRLDHLSFAYLGMSRLMPDDVSLTLPALAFQDFLSSEFRALNSAGLERPQAGRQGRINRWNTGSDSVLAKDPTFRPQGRDRGAEV